MIRVTLPHHLRQLANVNGEIALQVEVPITQRSILDALEARYPMLCGTIRDHTTHDCFSVLCVGSSQLIKKNISSFVNNAFVKTNS